ncbi:MAG: hypothetical protein ACJ79E_10215 [Anaeromyxobacteraceae bacterium]
MPVQTAFAPYRLPPGALPEEASRRATASAAEPLVVRLDEPLPGSMVGQALADVAAGHAAGSEEGCRAADGTPSGLPGPLRACLVSDRHRASVESAIASALAAGFAGVCLDRPDAPIAQGFLGSGFCPDCQRFFSKELAREYGDHFMPLDYLALAREALAQASGAVTFAQLPFGRDFWRMRVASLDRAVGAYARAARDASRKGGRPFEVTAQFEAIGPAQLRAARHLDAAIFPVKGEAQTTGAGRFRLLRAVMGRRPCAAALIDGPALPLAQRLAGVAAASGVELIGLPAGDAAELAALRRFARLVTAQRHAPGVAEAVFECAILYSHEADLWTGGDHRVQVERAGDALAALQIQAPVVTRLDDAPPHSVLVLAGAAKLGPQEAAELKRRVEAGAGALVVGELGAVDSSGREAPAPLPVGKPAGVRVANGTVATIPPLPAPRPGAVLEPAQLDALARPVAMLLGRGRRAASVAGRTPVLAALYRNEERLDAHLVTLGAGVAQGATLFLGLHVAGTARRARFQSAGGGDEKITMNPSGYSISTVLPAFKGYAVLSVGAGV